MGSLALLLILGWITVDLLSVYAGRGTTFGEGSSYRSDRVGTRAFYLLLEEYPQYYSPKRIKTDTIGKRPSGVAFIVAEEFDWQLELFTTPDDEDPLENWHDWVKNGGRLVLFTRKCDFKFGETEVRVAAIGYGEEAPQTYTANGSSPEYDHIFARYASIVTELSVTDGQPILTSDAGPVAMKVDIDLGELLVIADTYPISNKGLAQATVEYSDNIDLCFELAAMADSLPTNVYFFETPHGVVENLTIMGLARRYALHFFLLQLLLVTLLGIWSIRKRLGRPVSRPQPPVTREAEFARSVAALYREAMPRAAILNSLLSELTERAGISTRIKPSSEPAVLQEVLQNAGLETKRSREIAVLYRRYMRDRKAGPPQMLHFSTVLSKAMEELDEQR